MNGEIAEFTARLNLNSKIDSNHPWMGSSNEALDKVMLCLHDAEQLDKPIAERRLECLMGAWWFFNTWKALAQEGAQDA